MRELLLSGGIKKQRTDRLCGMYVSVLYKVYYVDVKK